jgi:hypothetical protein
MQFIDKKLHRIEGHAIVKKFIEGQWQDNSQYINLDYESFPKDEMAILTMSEQNEYCCYCMRELSTENVTLEHVIPNRTTQIKYFNSYLGYGELNDKNIFLWKKERNKTELQVPPFPHFIAYENLVASCNGVVRSTGQIVINLKCCNNGRGNQEIIPLFFKSNVKDILVYEKDGKLTYDDEYETTIRALNLEHETMQLLRKAWHSICSTTHSVEDVNNAIWNTTKRYDILDDCNLTTNNEEMLIKDIYWKLLAEYSWFHSYYLTRIA